MGKYNIWREDSNETFMIISNHSANHPVRFLKPFVIQKQSLKVRQKKSSKLIGWAPVNAYCRSSSQAHKFKKVKNMRNHAKSATAAIFEVCLKAFVEFASR